MTTPLLIYGAYGYTGELIARTAKENGYTPVLAGRSEQRLAPLANELGLPYRCFALDRSDPIDQGLEGVDVVLHCAGPFSRTSMPMVEGCLRTRTHYLDITGEVEVFEATAARGTEAEARGVMLMPGVGFDVVPSDCLAAHLKRRLPEADQLVLAFVSLDGVSHGTAVTMAENVHAGGVVRRAGALQRVPAAYKTRRVDFGPFERTCITIPWGDVSTAYHSTGIPNIEVYMAAPGLMRVAVRSTRYLGWLLRRPGVQRILRRTIDARPAGPTADERRRGRSYLFGEVTSSAGERRVSRLETPESYALTAEAAVEVAGRVLRGEVRPGYMTPSKVYGPDLVVGLEGVIRTDEEG